MTLMTPQGHATSSTTAWPVTADPSVVMRELSGIISAATIGTALPLLRVADARFRLPAPTDLLLTTAARLVDFQAVALHTEGVAI
jgi:hypothetical protein